MKVYVVTRIRRARKLRRRQQSRKPKTQKKSIRKQQPRDLQRLVHKKKKKKKRIADKILKFVLLLVEFRAKVRFDSLKGFALESDTIERRRPYLFFGTG
jgi:hypothetical protein